MSRIASGITGASPIWNKIMTALLAEKEPVAWESSRGVGETASLWGKGYKARVVCKRN